jgi:hypothetical protein
MQVLAPVSTATTSFMSLLNTSSSVIHYLVLGELPFGYGAAVFAVGALGKCFDVALYVVCDCFGTEVLTVALWSM